MSRPAALFGTFDAERSWEEPEQARLPLLRAPFPDDAIAAMDELLIAWCGEGDVALTRRPLLVEHREHLISVGLLDALAPTHDLMAALPKLAASHCLAPWAVTAEVETLWRRFDLAQPLPSLAVVRRVNSKVWSSALRKRLGLPGCANAVHSASELRAVGTELLARSTAGIVVKEPHGVSGRGSVLIPSPRRLERLVATIEREESRGRSASFVVEPFVHKRFDFSTQLTIAADGTITLDSIHGLLNRGFSYAASHRITDEHARLLEHRDLASQVLSVARAVAQEGYFGPLCIDGMLLADGTLMPLVEINARGSLGAINAQLDRRHAVRGLRSYLTAIRVTSEIAIPFAAVLGALRDAELLANERRSVGGVILTARTLPFGGGTERAEQTARAGRLFVSLLYQREEEVPQWLARARASLGALGYQLMDA